MFWKKNKTSDKHKKSVEQKRLQGGSGVQKKSDSQRLREEALANAAYAREQIGQEALDKIAAALTKKEQSNLERAKTQIADQDADRVVAEILLLMEED